MNPHFRKPNPTESEIEIARAEVACSGVSQDAAFERCMEARRALIDAYRDWAVCGAELPMLGQMGVDVRDAMAVVWKLAKEGLMRPQS